jgi:adhesin transport system outer membrane protein
MEFPKLNVLVISLGLFFLGGHAYSQAPQIVSNDLKIADIGIRLDRFSINLMDAVEKQKDVKSFESLKSEVSSVFSSTPSILRTIETQSFLDAKRAEAFSRFLPQVRGSFSSGDQKIRYSDRSNLNDQGGISANGITVSQLLFDFGATSKTYQSSEASRNAGKAKIQQDRSSALLALIRSRIELRRTSQRLELVNAFVESRKQFLDLVRQKAVLGVNSNADIIRAESKVFEAADELPFALKRFNEAKLRYKELYGKENKGVDAYQGPALNIAEFENADLTLETLGAVIEARGMLKAAENDHEAAKARLLGTTQLESSRNQSRTDLYGPRSDSSLQVVYRVEFYSGGAQMAVIDQTAAKRNELKWEVERIEREQRRVLQESFANYLAQKTSVTSRISVLRGVKAASDITKELFNYSRSSLTDVFKVQEDYLAAAKNLVETESDFQVSYYEMLHSYNLLLKKFEISI